MADERDVKTKKQTPPEVDGLLSAGQLVFERGLVLMLQGNAEKAREVLAPLAEESRSSEPELRHAARFLLGQTSAAEYLEAVDDEVYFRNDAHYHVGVTHELAGRMAEARAAYQKSVSSSIGGNHPVALARDALERLKGK